MKQYLDYRFAKPTDAASFIVFQKKLAKESDYLLLTEEETNGMTIEKQEKLFESMVSGNGSSWVLVAELNNEIVGFAGFTTNSLVKSCHVVNKLAIGVVNEYKQQKIATHLMKLVEEHCLKTQIKRIEFTVQVKNIPAINLYLKHGFIIEGIRQGSIKSTCGALSNEYYLGKVIC